MAENNAEKVAEILLSAEAVSVRPEEPFTYTSGILSPVYSDLRLLISYVEPRRQVVDMLVEAIRKKGRFDLIGATATAAVPWGAWVSEKMDLPMVYVRSEAKKHGKENKVEGRVEPGQNAVVVEDLISTGGSSIGSAEGIRELGGKVGHVVAIFNYTMPQSATNFRGAKLETTSLTTFPDVLELAVAKGAVKPADTEIILDWLQDTAGWGKKHGYE